MSRGLGKLQRAILEALPAHELAQCPGVYDLKKLRIALSQATGRGWYVRGRYSRERNIWAPDPTFTGCFARAVQTLITREMLTTRYKEGPITGVSDWARWRLPYVRRTDKR
jgi:hypothetical protein